MLFFFSVGIGKNEGNEYVFSEKIGTVNTGDICSLLVGNCLRTIKSKNSHLALL